MNLKMTAWFFSCCIPSSSRMLPDHQSTPLFVLELGCFNDHYIPKFKSVNSHLHSCIVGYLRYLQWLTCFDLCLLNIILCGFLALMPLARNASLLQSAPLFMWVMKALFHCNGMHIIPDMHNPNYLSIY